MTARDHPATWTALSSVLRVEPAPVEVAVDAVDWELFERVCHFHSVQALAYHGLRGAGFGPDAVAERLRPHADRLAAATMLRKRAYTGAASTLAQAGIRPMLLKGAAMNETIYPHPGLRSMGDIDVLVRPDEVDEAEALLRADGWTPVLTERDAAWMRDNHRHLGTLQSPDETLHLELHRRPLDRADPAILEWIDDSWSRAQQTSEGLVVPDPIDQVIHLATHMLHDLRATGRGALRRLVDVAELLRRTDERAQRELGAVAARAEMLEHIQMAAAMVRTAFGPEPSTSILGDSSERRTVEALVVRATREWDWRSVVPHRLVRATTREVRGRVIRDAMAAARHRHDAGHAKVADWRDVARRARSNLTHPRRAVDEWRVPRCVPPT